MGFFGKKQEQEEIAVIEQPQVVEEPAPAPEPIKEQVTTVIGEGITIVGDFSANEDIKINGTIKGNILSECNLSISKTGKLQGNASVKNLDSDGEINGEVHATSTTKLGSHSVYVGTLHTKTIIVDDGAQFDGQLKLGQKKDNKDTEAKAEEKKEDAAEEKKAE